MNLKEATINYANLVAHQDKYLQDLAAKYSIIADNYIASGTLDDIKINKKKLSVILADNIVNLMIFLKLQGQLNAYIARNPNLGTFLDPKHPNSVTKAAMKLKNTGCAVNKDEKIASLTDTLKFWDVEEVKQDDIDDIDMSDMEGDTQNQGLLNQHQFQNQHQLQFLSQHQFLSQSPYQLQHLHQYRT